MPRSNLPSPLLPVFLLVASSLASSLVVASAHAAEPISGVVLNAVNGKPVPEARVQIRGGGPADLSRADGSFTLVEPPAGAFVLVVTCPGFEPTLLRLRGPQDGRLELRLVPLKGADDEVVVTASRNSSRVPLAHTNLTREDLARRDTDQDLPMLLNEIPGVWSTSDSGSGAGYSYLSIRGFDAKRVGVMINGIPLNDPEDQQVYWVDMPDFASSLEDVQVQRGVVNGVGGVTAIGGTVNLVTEVLGVEPGGRMAFHGGSYGTQVQSLAYHTGLLAGRFSTGMRVSHLESDGYRDRSGTDQWAVFWSGRLVSPRASLQANVYTGRELTQQAWYPIDEATWDQDPRANPETYWNSVDDFRQPHYELHHEWRPSERLTLRNTVFYIHGEGYYENLKSGVEAGDYGLDALAMMPSGRVVDLVRRKWVHKDQVGWLPSAEIEHPRGRLLVGGDTYLFRSLHEGLILYVPGYLGPDAMPEGMPYHRYRGRKNAWAAYVDERVEPLKDLTLLANLQFQHRNYSFAQDEVAAFYGDDRHAYDVTWNFLNPRGGLSYRIPPSRMGVEATFYGWVGVSHREPSDAEMFDTWEGPDDIGAEPLFRERKLVERADGSVDHVQWSDPLVEPERVIDYELGTTWRSRVLDLALNGYWMDFRDEIIAYGALSDDGEGIRGNAERTLHRGLELGIGLRPAEGQALALAAARSWNTFDTFTFYDWDGSVTEYAGNAIAGSPDWTANVRWTADWRWLESTLRVRGNGRIQLDNSGLRERSIDPSVVMDVGLAALPSRWGLKGTRGLRVSATCRNVLDARYATSGYYDGWGAGNYVIPAAGRNFLAGATYEF